MAVAATAFAAGIAAGLVVVVLIGLLVLAAAGISPPAGTPPQHWMPMSTGPAT